MIKISKYDQSNIKKIWKAHSKKRVCQIMRSKKGSCNNSVPFLDFNTKLNENLSLK